jgi:hypothetical protein
MVAVMVAGCKKEEEKAPPSPVTPAPMVKKDVPKPVEPVRAPAVKLTPTDEQDDARFGALFPASEKVEGWIKTAPVRGGDGAKIAEFLPQLGDVLASFSADSVAAAQYQRLYNNETETIKVILIKAASKKDAYGMMSVSCPGADILKPGEVWRMLGVNQVCVVKGDYFLIFSAGTTGDAEHLQAGLEMLIAKMNFEIPERAEIPMIIQVFQTEKMPAAATLFMHDLNGLNGPAGREIVQALDPQDLKRLNKLFALSPEVEFGVALYKSEDWLGPNIVWLVKYPTQEEAQAAYYRYRKETQAAAEGDTLMYNSFLKAPRGRFFLGTWTVETESLAHLTNEIEKYLP